MREGGPLRRGVEAASRLATINGAAVSLADARIYPVVLKSSSKCCLGAQEL